MPDLDPHVVRSKWTRRAILRGGISAAAVIGVSSCKSDHHIPKAGAGAGAPAMPGPRDAVIRFSLRDSTEGWSASANAPGTVVSNDPAGWLRVAGSGNLQVSSPRPTTPVSWALSDRDNDDRLTVSVLVQGPADSYDLTIGFRWSASGSDGAADSVPLKIPTGHAVDVDSSWTCRSNAPTDVLSRVELVTMSLANPQAEPVEMRIRDVRQPPSTAPSGAAGSGVGRAFHATAPVGLPAPTPADAYQGAVLAQLQRVIDWGTDNERAIHIGEWAWPKESRRQEPGADASQVAYRAMAEQWLRLADRNAVVYTPWGESAYWSGATSPVTDYGSYPDASYYCGGSASARPRVISEVKPSASLLADHIDAVPGRPGSINLVGMCFIYLRDGSQYSSTNIGVRGSDYLAESAASIAFLHGLGYRIFRLAFRWDRVMRTPDASTLDADEWGYVEQTIDTILALPDTAVIVDVHCGGIFFISPDPDDKSVPAVKNSIDGPTGVVTTQMFVDFWLLMSRRLRNRSERLVYELANEPHDTNPFLVRRWTQAVVTAIRKDGDETFCLIPSYPFDNVSQALTEETLPFPWIEDSAGTRRHAYTIHHYMDLDQSGQYSLSYAESLASINSK